MVIRTTGTATAPARYALVSFNVADLHEALEVVRQFDPQGIACRDLRECLLYQLRYHLDQLQLHKTETAPEQPRPIRCLAMRLRWLTSICAR